MEEIILNDYEYELIEMDDGCSLDFDIMEEDLLTDKEKEEIEYTTEELNEEYLELNGWCHCDTKYIMGGPVEFE